MPGASPPPPSSPAAACETTLVWSAPSIPQQSAREAFLQLLHRLIDGERSGPLARRKLLVAFEVLSDHVRCRERDVRLTNQPVVIRVRRDVRTFERVGPQVVE